MALDTAERIARLVDERIRDRQRLAEAAAEQKTLVAASGSPAPPAVTGVPPAAPGVPPAALGLPLPPLPPSPASAEPSSGRDLVRALRAENLALRRQLDNLTTALLALADRVGPSALEEIRRHLAPPPKDDPDARPQPQSPQPEGGDEASGD